MKWSDWRQSRGITHADCCSGSLMHVLRDSLGASVVAYDAPDRHLTETTLQLLNTRYAQWAAGMPLAYILGYVPFLDLRIQVNSDVLIPRPETEMWVDFCRTTERRSTARVLDIGVGSGCIAIALQHHQRHWQVWGCDTSQRALMLAADNARACGVTLQLRQWDLFHLQDDPQAHTWDMIVSNPPYLTAQEWKDLPDLHWEPQQALMDPWGSGVAPYAAILAYSAVALRPGGTLWLEHGYQQRQSISAMVLAQGLQVLACHEDAAGHPRFIVCGRK